MEFNVGKLDGQNFLGDGTLGILYTQRNWTRLVTDDESINTEGEHGRTVSPEYVRKRIITIEGYIDRLGNVKEQEAVDYLQKLFAYQSNTGKIIPRTLFISDGYDREREIAVKVKEQIDIIAADDSFKEAAYKWRVVLESTEAPFVLSAQEILKTGLEGQYGGFEMDPIDGFVFDPDDGLTLDDYFNFIECESGGNLESLPRIEIIATGIVNTPLTVKNLTDGTFFELDIGAVPGDKIIIDSNDYTVTKNGVNISYTRAEGSTRPTINGVTRFGIEDEDGAIPEMDISISIYFKNCLL